MSPPPETKKCDPITSNILPVDLDMANMINSSEQLTNLTYDFSPCKNYNLKIECPSWMNSGWEGACKTGAIKIEQEQDNTEVDLLNFTSVGKLTGSGTSNHILCYYFPKNSLNRYNGGDW